MLRRQLKIPASSSGEKSQLEMAFKEIPKAPRLEKRMKGVTGGDKKEDGQRGKRQVTRCFHSQGSGAVEDHQAENGSSELDDTRESVMSWKLRKNWVVNSLVKLSQPTSETWPGDLATPKPSTTLTRAFSMEMHLVGLSSKESEEPAAKVMRNDHCQDFTTKVCDVRFLSWIQASIMVQELALARSCIPTCQHLRIYHL